MFTLSQLQDMSTVVSQDPAKQGEALAALILTLAPTQESPTIASAPVRKQKTVTAKKSAKVTRKPVAKKAAPTIAAKPAPVRKQTAKRDSSDFWNGPATQKQIRRNTAFAAKHGFEAQDMTGWTAQMASDDLKEMKAIVAND